MNRFPHETGRFPPKRSVSNPTGIFVPPPPLPPWVCQPNFLPPSPLAPPLIPLNFPPPHPFQTNLPPFSALTFQGPTLRHTNIPVGPVVSGGNELVHPKDISTDSQAQVDYWLRGRELSSKVVKTPPKTNIQIHVVKGKLNDVFSLIKDLENGALTLGVMVKTVTEAEWEQKCTEIETKKRQLSELLEELNLSKEDLGTFKEKVIKRSKKRERLKRQKQRWKKLKEEEKLMIQNKHVQLDNWLAEMQEGVERIQREEELKREADAVLWTITQKKNESRRQVSLLSALQELRQVKVKQLVSAGKLVSETQIQVFNTVIERLQDMWRKHLEEISLEEQMLRGMLTQAEVKDDPVKRHKKLVLQEWETAIFGSVGSLNSNMKGEELENVRWSWDQFVVPEHTLMSSTAPPGWVLPVPPSSDEWRTLLKY